MNVRTVLTKIITLIYRTRLLDSDEYDSLIKTSLETVRTDGPDFNFSGNNYIKSMKELCNSLLEDKEHISKEVLIPQLNILLEHDPKLFTAIKESIEPEYDEASNKRIVASLVKNLNNFYREHLAVEILSKVNYDLKFNRSRITNFGDYLKNTIAELEPLSETITSIKDPAVVNEVDFENSDSVNTVFDEVKNLNSNDGVYKLGWQKVNTMLQGGLRRSESLGILALQHKYKTGGTLSIFSQIATLNTPIATPEEVAADKKPLLLRISFEDNLTNNLQFLYQYLKANEGIQVSSRDFNELSTKEMTDYITSKLTATGFRIRLLRVDPSQWSYLSIINKVIELEAQGYAVHMLMLDYLLKIPTTGCAQGPAGTDKRDLVRRMRNFCSARNILFVTPFQLSTEAKQLIRNGVPEHQFVNEIAEKGYYDSCRTIDQELDIELYLHIFNHKRKKYISFRRGKHRIPTVISDEDKFCMYRFPNLNTPVLEDINGEDSSFSVLPKDSDEGSSLLDEIIG